MSLLNGSLVTSDSDHSSLARPALQPHCSFTLAFSTC